MARGIPATGCATSAKYDDLLFVPVFVILFQDGRTRELGLKAFGGAVLVNLIMSHLAYQDLLIDNVVLDRVHQSPSGFKFTITHSLLMSYGAFMFSLLAREETRRPWRIVFVILAMFAAHNVLLMVFSRTGYLVVSVLLLYLFIVSFKWRGAIAAFALGSALLGSAYIGSDVFRQRIDSVGQELGAWQGDRLADTSVGVRMELYSGSLEIIREHPVFGAGTGSFPLAYAATHGDAKLADANNPHNEYLLIACQLGMVGLACLIYLFYLQWRLAAQLTPLYRDLARGLVLTMVTGCMFNSLLLDHTEGLWFAWASGLLVRRAQAAGHAGGARDDSIRSRNREERSRASSRAALSRLRGPTKSSCSMRRARTARRTSRAKLKAKVTTTADWPGFGAQKNRALELATGDWVLSLDADEWVTPELRAEIEHAIGAPGNLAAFRMPRLSSYCGRFMRHSGWWPDYVTRVFRRGAARFSDDLVHERLIVDGAIGALRESLMHEAIADLADALEKMNAYSTAGAAMQFERGKTASLAGAVVHGAWTFVRTYVLRGGFLDGREGFMLAVSNAEGAYYRYLKLMILA